MHTLKIDPQEYASQGAAILGIRDSGKSYTATKIGEQLFDAGIPFVAFDPIGLWRFMRMPGIGRGYPIVVAGGEEGDLPLTPNNAAAIVRAAMQGGVSLVVDLFDPRLSKADWKRIVESCVSTLLFENKKYGLRHIFVEEAAEFVPQIIPKDGVTASVYSIFERLSRMGGNNRLGYTLINQRAEQVNKAVLELCDNLLLHRQKGKNSINSLGKWLDIAGVDDAKAIERSLPTLPQGECWTWLAGHTHATLVKVPQKNSFSPDRRAMRGDKEIAIPKAVDTAKFVDALKGRLGDIEAEAKANDPRALKAEVLRLQGELRKAASQTSSAKPSTVTDDALEKAERRGFDKGVSFATGTFRSAVVDAQNAAAMQSDLVRKELTQLEAILTSHFRNLSKTIPAVSTEVSTKYAAKYAPAANVVTKTAPRAPRPTNGHDELTTPQRRIMASLGFWKSIGHDSPSRPQVAAIAGYTHTSGSFRNTISSLNVAGLLRAPNSGQLALAETATFEPLTQTDAREKLLSILGGPERRIIAAMINEAALSREDVAARASYEATSGSFRNTISSLNVLDVLTKPSAGMLSMSDWAREVLT